MFRSGQVRSGQVRPTALGQARSRLCYPYCRLSLTLWTAIRLSKASKRTERGCPFCAMCARSGHPICFLFPSFSQISVMPCDDSLRSGEFEFKPFNCRSSFTCCHITILLHTVRYWYHCATVLLYGSSDLCITIHKA